MNDKENYYNEQVAKQKAEINRYTNSNVLAGASTPGSLNPNAGNAEHAMPEQTASAYSAPVGSIVRASLSRQRNDLRSRLHLIEDAIALLDRNPDIQQFLEVLDRIGISL